MPFDKFFQDEENTNNIITVKYVYTIYNMVIHTYTMFAVVS